MDKNEKRQARVAQVNRGTGGADRHDFGGKVSRRHPAFGAMKDVTWIAPGVDLTEPAMPEWADFIDEKYGRPRNP